MFSSIAIVAGLASLPFTTAAVHEQLAAVPFGWTETEAPSDNEKVTLAISLSQQNVDKLAQTLASVSTPGSAKYGQYMSQSEVQAMFGASGESEDAVMKWLDKSGVAAHSDGTTVALRTTVSTANSLLNAKFTNFEDSEGNSKLRTLGYSVPDELSSHISMISPTTFFGKTRAFVPARPRGSANTKRIPNQVAAQEASLFRRETPKQINETCIAHNVSIGNRSFATIGPECFKIIYNVTDYVPDPACGSKVGFGSFLNESAVYKDLFQFEKVFGIPKQNISETILINGATNDQNIKTAMDGEADLDVQNIIGISHPLPVIEFITGGSPPYIPDLDEGPGNDQNEPYRAYYNYLLAQQNEDLPQVISNSYGDPEQTVPFNFAVHVCNQIGMLGLRGISVLESAGDLGVGSACRANDGSNKRQFEPIFPATCPYITSVGGTQSLEPEIAWTAGSGGFSNYFAGSQAYYQVNAVQNYLNNEISPAVKKYYTNPKDPFVNFTGRGFPDISAHSLSPDYQVVNSGEVVPSGGTSAASPLWAGIIGLLNDARIRNGQPALGFLNPWLYSVGYKGLTDVTGGQAVGCNGIDGQTGEPVVGGGVIPFATWNATKGWDPVTGLGLPNFGLLKELALAS